MLDCPNYGKRAKKGDSFCHKCGQPLDQLEDHISLSPARNEQESPLTETLLIRTSPPKKYKKLWIAIASCVLIAILVAVALILVLGMGEKSYLATVKAQGTKVLFEPKNPNAIKMFYAEQPG